MAQYICNGHRLDLSLLGIEKTLTNGDVVELDPARAKELIDNGFPLSPEIPEEKGGE